MKEFFLIISMLLMGVMIFISLLLCLVFSTAVKVDPGYGCATSLGIAGFFFSLSFVITIICIGFWEIMDMVCSDGKGDNKKVRIGVPVVYLILIVLVFFLTPDINKGHHDFEQPYPEELPMEYTEVEYENDMEVECKKEAEVEYEKEAEVEYENDVRGR